MVHETKGLSPLEILHLGPVIPVIILNHARHAVPLAQALLDGGVQVVEITLRSAAALEGIRRIRAEVPEILVGAGTVLNAEHLQEVAQAGAQFAISPGLTPALFAAAYSKTIPLIPGIATPSELMLAQERGFTALKFFPAEAAGGVQMLQSLAGPFPQISFCPTGGITLENCKTYLALSNVACVGSSWMAPPELIEEENWKEIKNRVKNLSSLYDINAL